jgi:hypothetical protein
MHYGNLKKHQQWEAKVLLYVAKFSCVIWSSILLVLESSRPPSKDKERTSSWWRILYYVFSGVKDLVNI